ncbi:MAG: ABC transporter substrate-binding protein [Archangium sp.]|nr:ABC transporter substrate-binding protein [Archangium sp.]
MWRLPLTLSLLFTSLAQAGELTPITLQLKWRHQFQFAGYYMAEARGYYRDAGLAVRFAEATPGMQPIDEVLSGNAQFGVGTTDLLLYRHQQKPVVAVAAIFQHSPIALMTLERAGHSLLALKGKRVMVEPHSAELAAFLAREGLGPGSVQQVEHSFDPIDLVEGRVDAMSVYVTDEPWTLSTQGVPHSLFPPRNAGIDFYGDTLFSTERYIAAHPGVVAAFREASLRGWREAMADPDAAIDLILQLSDRKSRPQLRFEADVMAPLLQFELIEPGYMSPVRWRAIAGVYTEAGLLPPDVALDGFLYTAPAPTPRWVPFTLAGLIALALVLALGAGLIARSNRRTRESEARFRTLFELSPDPCFLLRDGRFVDCNLATARALGFATAEALVGKRPLDISPPTQEGGQPSEALAARYVEQALREGLSRFEWDHLHVDGHKVPMRVTLAKMVLDGQDALFASAQDISETRELEHSLRQASAEASAASRLKSQFLANMSHEVRTPLAAIVGLAQLGRDATTLEEAREHFATVAGAGQTMLSLANDLLDVSRLEAGRMRIEDGQVDVRALVEQSVALLKAQAKAKGLSLDITFEPKGELTVTGDRGRLGQVLTNLLSNAVKFTEAGGVSVRVEAKDGTLSISVTDTGVGLSPAQQARLFEPFTQVDESVTRRHGGAGLGLALSRQLARLMGGDLTLQSATGQGSTFTCTVPATIVAAVAPSARPDVSLDLANLRVLVVEDNKVNQLLATSLLRKAGASSEVAENGVLAIARLERGPTDFDVVLMDVQMPELDGLETTRALRRRVAFEKTPIVALTAHALEEERERCLAAGMNGYLSKPIEVGTFYATLRQYRR